jgi:hypothetical protein
MRRILVLSAAVIAAVISASAVDARPGRHGMLPQKALLPGETERAATYTEKVSSPDTMFFGGTYWNASQSRWEANVSNDRTNAWTFDSGVDGNMEGWTGRDLTRILPPTLPPGSPDNADFRWTDDARYALYGTPGTDLFPTATPLDNGGLWCAKYEAEADELCWEEGQGCGNNWQHEAMKTFAYGGTGDVRLTFRYFSATEKNFDYNYLFLEFNGTRETTPRQTYTFFVGSPVSKRTKTLTISASTIPSGTTQITAVWKVYTDGGYSDEDGQFATTYGNFCLYNFKYENLDTPANNDEDTFETGPEGWTFVQPPGIGDFVGIANVANLPPPETSCPCVGPILQGNVLTLYDQGAGPDDQLHPDGQDAMAVSPYLDLAAAGAGNAPIKYVQCDFYASLPLSNAVYYKAWLRQYPVLCTQTGLLIEDDVAPDPFISFIEPAFCGNDIVFQDFSTVSSDIQYCYVEIEVLSLCSVSEDCTVAGGNTTPWFDNIQLVVTGTPGAPAVSTTDIQPFYQDIFAADGSLRPKATCDLDASGDVNFGSTESDSRLQDSIYATASADQIEVRLCFRYVAGPGTNRTNPFFARYPLEGTWYAARCDTAIDATGELQGSWMSDYHEASPYFAGEGAADNEILPDGLFTPGSQIDYYWSANYLATPGLVFSWPDVPAGRQALEVTLLPRMRVTAPGDTLWPCTLYINGMQYQPLTGNSAYHTVERSLDFVMGGTGRFDRYDDCLITSNTNASFARQVLGDNGMTELQALGYRTILTAYGGSESRTITDEDGSLLAFWLSTTAGGANENRQILYFTGDGLAVDMSNIGKPNATSLLNSYFGVSFTCSPYRDALCPLGSTPDTTWCVQVSPAGGPDPAFVFTGSPYRVRGNGCPLERSFSVIDVNAGVPTARPNLSYVDQDGSKGTTEYASVTNDRGTIVQGNYKTVFDAFGLTRLARPVSTWNCSRDSLAIIDRLDDVLTWGALGAGGLPIDCSGEDIDLTDAGDDAAGAPKVNGLSVGPNPFNPLVKLNYAVATPGRVSLRIYDVRGALVTTLVDEVKTQGRYQAVWAGQDDAGRKMPSGVFWAKYSVGKNDITRQLVLLK